MCGFAGFIDYSKTSSRETLVKMCDVIAHRGPDSGSYFFQEEEGFTLGLGHRRLSIIDLHATANQPMFYKDWVIVFNGEIYNYQEIKDDLINLGHHFDTQSDTEVILHSFEQWGTEAVNRFIGMFAYLIYDRQKKEIITVRDRPGVKPLHVYQNEQILMWASEIKSFHQHPLFKKELNPDAVKRFLQYGYIPTPNSIFLKVRKQLPGSIETFELAKRTTSTVKYWDVADAYRKPVLDIDYATAKIKTSEILKTACDYRMVADVPVGVFLSGGYDSTLVTALLQQDRADKIKTFTIGVDDRRLNEAKFAKEIASRLGTEHTEYYITEKEMFNLIDDLPFHFDEPFGDSSAVPTMLVSQVAREKVTVALSADGGDEVFGGYNRYDRLKQLKQIRLLKKIGLPVSFLAKNVIKNPKSQERILDLVRNPDVFTLANQLNNPYVKGETDRFFRNEVNDLKCSLLTDLDSIDDDLRLFMAIDYKTYLLDDILTKVDRATMRSSLEGREPLLDQHVIEFAAQLPNDFKIRNGKKKFILKDIVHDFVPQEIMERPKMGFAAPVEDWLRNNLKQKLDYYFSDSFLDAQAIFSNKEVQRMLEAFRNGKTNTTVKIWYFLMFQMWYQKWMMNEN
ncbi:asparagine synthase (glutamine-hydrolyzing) [Kaistella sp. PBT33-4]|uniref:asparagine synthase (glutamine-hydrolyzing) n=1 Tax=Kaistella sp. PBT33-4 TaxID=3032000 RepID=UPI0023D8B55A|nr:asparagine synthase (glutamine-hydrolyzing) [Kaistella sp. PBT33-4]MDF0718783.1 asparagine synthase (glutamine-hydrolyzing) [Kaistella sp. PBT33-4]